MDTATENKTSKRGYVGKNAGYVRVNTRILSTIDDDMSSLEEKLGKSRTDLINEALSYYIGVLRQAGV